MDSSEMPRGLAIYIWLLCDGCGVKLYCQYYSLPRLCDLGCTISQEQNDRIDGAAQSSGPVSESLPTTTGVRWTSWPFITIVNVSRLLSEGLSKKTPGSRRF